MALPSSGLTEVDTLILRASEQNLSFPPDVKRWQLLSWTSEALDLIPTDPRAFERGGFRAIPRRHFPTSNP